jgi:outer membrane biosynthesis protein TonB
MNSFRQIIDHLKNHIGISISGLLHFILFIFLIVNFPQCSNKKNNEIIIALDLLPVLNKTNVENKQISQPQKQPPKEEKPKESANTSKEEPVHKEELKPKEVKKEEIAVKKKPEPKKVEKPEEKPKPKAPQPKKKDEKKKSTKPVMSDIDKLLKNLQAEEKKHDSKDQTNDKPSKGPFDPESSLSISVKDSIKRQIEQHWNPPAGNKEAARLQILLKIAFKPDGSVANVKVIDNNRYSADEQYQVAADAAVRAVHKASPLQNLPAEQFSSWQNIELNFDPSSILGD